MADPENFITDDTTLKGHVSTASSLQVAGVIEGDVNSGRTVTVLADGLIKGDVSAVDVMVHGRIEGRVTTTGKLTIAATGVVVGDIQVRSIYIEDGGVLDGKVAMGEPRRPADNIPPPNI